MGFEESKKYWREQPKYEGFERTNLEQPERALLKHVLDKTAKDDPQAVLKGMDEHCRLHQMMHIGDQKGRILTDTLQQEHPKKILELGTYCGYSSLLMAETSQAHVHTVEPNQDFLNIARQILDHAGVSGRITLHKGVIQDIQQLIKKQGPFDLIFLDHLKDQYLNDLDWLESKGGVRQGTVVAADNMIYQGCPKHLAKLKDSPNYSSIMYHSFNAYSDQPDAVLVSRRTQAL